MDRIEIKPASLAQVAQTRSGHTLLIDNDVQGVANALHEIHPDLRLEFDPHADYYCVIQTIHEPDGSTSDHLVTTAQDLDHRIVHRVRQVASSAYDYVAELEATDEQAKRNAEHVHSEKMGDLGEKLAHALCKDLGINNHRAVVPKDVT